MFFIAIFALALAACALNAILLALASRLVLRVSLTFGSAFKASFLVLAVGALIALALQLAGIRLWRAFSSPIADALPLLIGVALQASFLAWLGKTTDGDSVSLRQAAIAVMLASLVGYAIGWMAWKAYAPPGLAPSQSDVSGQTLQLNARSQLCLRNLSQMLSDTGSGPKPGAASEFQQRLEQDARTRAITMEEALKQELRRLGTKPPFGCDHLK